MQAGVPVEAFSSEAHPWHTPFEELRCVLCILLHTSYHRTCFCGQKWLFMAQINHAQTHSAWSDIMRLLLWYSVYSSLSRNKNKWICFPRRLELQLRKRKQAVAHKQVFVVKSKSADTRSKRCPSKDVFSIWKIWQHIKFASELRVRLSVYSHWQEPSLPPPSASFSYQGVEHQSIKSVTVRVLHHDVEESIQSVLQELEWQKHSVLR